MIAAAGIAYRNIKIPCRTHAEGYKYLHKTYSAICLAGPKVEGFFTDKGIFLNRAQAWRHAVKCGQVYNSPNRKDKRLYGKDLW